MSDEYVGLSLITFNDEENLKVCLESLINTLDYPTIIHCSDLNSTDSSLEQLKDFKLNGPIKNKYIIDVVIESRGYLEYLTSTLNNAFRYLLTRQECNMVGWIHPDMVFERPWLGRLVARLNSDSKLGKLCAFNTRDGGPTTASLVPGHEQCYIIKRGVILEVGFFDEKFIGIGGFEDLDLNRRILNGGFSVMIDPTVQVNHKAMETRKRRDTSAEGRHNRAYYKEKYGDAKDGEMFVGYY